MGFDYYVDLHVVVNGDLSVRGGHLIAHQVKDALRAAYPRVADVLVHIEPDEKENLKNRFQHPNDKQDRDSHG
jgi:divalent metal cation (Fe/Co/Zn/Cd) transporter